MDQKFKDFDIQKYNILLMGEPGSGKSATINSLLSIFRGKFSQLAGVGSSDKAVT